MSKHRKHALFFLSAPRASFTVHGKLAAHASAAPTVEGPGWWQIVEELTPNNFTPATELFPDALWNDGNTALPGEDGWSVQPILDQLDALQQAHGRCFGANFQWPA